MKKYRLKEGAGSHAEPVAGGTKVFKSGRVVESDAPLDELFPNKFEVVPDKVKADQGTFMKSAAFSEKARKARQAKQQESTSPTDESWYEDHDPKSGTTRRVKLERDEEGEVVGEEEVSTVTQEMRMDRKAASRRAAGTPRDLADDDDPAKEEDQVEMPRMTNKRRQAEEEASEEEEEEVTEEENEEAEETEEEPEEEAEEEDLGDDVSKNFAEAKSAKLKVYKKGNIYSVTDKEGTKLHEEEFTRKKQVSEFIKEQTEEE